MKKKLVRQRLRKKGIVAHYLYLILMQIFLVSTVALAFGSHLYQIEQSTYFDKLYLTRDLSLIMSGLNGLPENFLYPYARKSITGGVAGEGKIEHEFTASFADSLVRVEEYGVKQRRSLVYPYATTDKGDLDPNFIIMNEPFFIFKDGNEYRLIKERERKELEQYTCEEVPSSTTTIVLDPGHGGLDKGTVYVTEEEKSITRELGRKINLGEYNKPVEETRDLERDVIDDIVTIQQRIKKIREFNGALVSIHIGERNENLFIAYIDADSDTFEESRYLGCVILNNLVKEFNGSKILLVPIDLDLLEKDDTKMVLQGSKVGVYLELVTMKSEHLQKLKEMGVAITTGIQEYIT